MLLWVGKLLLLKNCFFFFFESLLQNKRKDLKSLKKKKHRKFHWFLKEKLSEKNNWNSKFFIFRVVFSKLKKLIELDEKSFKLNYILFCKTRKLFLEYIFLFWKWIPKFLAALSHSPAPPRPTLWRRGGAETEAMRRRRWCAAYMRILKKSKPIYF